MKQLQTIKLNIEKLQKRREEIDQEIDRLEKRYRDLSIKTYRGLDE